MALFSTRLLISSSSLLLIFLLFNLSEAREIIVGGKTDSWTIPSSESQSLNKWAQNSRFNIGDTLVWKYDGAKDSVLQVTRDDYLSCNISSPIEEHKDGNTKVKLNKSGPFYFVSGVKDHCDKGQKLIVVVISPRHRFTGISSPATSPSPSPSPSDFEEGGGPAVAPTSSASSFKAGLFVGFGFLFWGLF